MLGRLDIHTKIHDRRTLYLSSSKTQRGMDLRVLEQPFGTRVKDVSLFYLTCLTHLLIGLVKS